MNVPFLTFTTSFGFVAWIHVKTVGRAKGTTCNFHATIPLRLSGEHNDSDPSISEYG